MTLLLTGFEPFGTHAINPSGDLARRFEGERFGGHLVRAAVLPVSRTRAWSHLQGRLDAVRPAGVFALGVSSRPRFSVERRAVNLDDYPIADNDGERPEAQPICEGPVELVCGFDLDRIAAPGVPLEISHDAGTYLCNHVYYRLLRAGVPSVFVHVPAYSIVPAEAQARAVHHMLTSFVELVCN